jgi:NitT/TauT family transport system substrate-binding protein
VKKTLSILCVILLLLLPLSACSGHATGKTLTIGALPSIDVMPFVIAEQQGYFKKYGVSFKLELFNSAKDRDAAFQAGTLDGLCCDEVAVCLYQNAGTDLKVTGMTDGEYVLVAGKDSGVKTIAELKGKSVAISEKTLIEYVLDSILAKNSLQAADVVKTAVPAVPVRLEMLNAKQVDAALLPEPFATFAINDGGVALSSATGIGLYPSVIAFPKPNIDSRHADIAAMYKAYNDAVDYLNSTPIANYEDLIIKTVGYPETMRGKIVLPKFTKNNLPLQGDLQAVIDWASAKGLCQKTLDPKNLVTAVR